MLMKLSIICVSLQLTPVRASAKGIMGFGIKNLSDMKRRITATIDYLRNNGYERANFSDEESEEVECLYQTPSAPKYKSLGPCTFCDMARTDSLTGCICQPHVENASVSECPCPRCKLEVEKSKGKEHALSNIVKQRPLECTCYPYCKNVLIDEYTCDRCQFEIEKYENTKQEISAIFKYNYMRCTCRSRIICDKNMRVIGKRSQRNNY